MGHCYSPECCLAWVRGHAGGRVWVLLLQKLLVDELMGGRRPRCLINTTGLIINTAMIFPLCCENFNGINWL